MRHTYTAVGPVDVEEREGEESLVAFFGEELLFELDKIGFEVNHFWCAAVSPAQKRQERFQQIWPCSEKTPAILFHVPSHQDIIRKSNTTITVRLTQQSWTASVAFSAATVTFSQGVQGSTKQSEILFQGGPLYPFHTIYTFVLLKKCNEPSRHCSPPPFHRLPGKLLGQWGVQRCEQALVSGTWNKRVTISELDPILLDPGIWTTSTTNPISKFKKKIQFSLFSPKNCTAWNALYAETLTHEQKISPLTCTHKHRNIF